MKTATKILRLLDMLSGIRSYTKKEICNLLEINERAFYRYIKTLRDFGFVINHDEGRYIIEKNNKTAQDLSGLLHFSEEEAYILNEAINTIDTSTKSKESLVGKLSALYDCDRIAVQFTAKENSSKIKPLLNAIRNKKKVKITEYKSSGSGKITDRIVEPFDFTANYISLWAYEEKSGTNKLFKVERMKKTEVLADDWQYENKHKADIVDCFRMSGKKKIPLKFEMSLLARNLLTEEYPLAERFIKKVSDNYYIFNGWIGSYEGVGRFITGLPGEIKNIENKDFTDYLKKYQKKGDFL